MTKLKFNKEQSLDEDEIVLEEVQESEEFTEQVEEPVYVMETPISTEPTKQELQLAQQLSGTPHAFGSEYQSVLESLCSKGIASNHAGLYGRGFRWHQFCK